MNYNIGDISKPLALDFLLRNCWELFFPYLSNLEIGLIDSSLTDIPLRKVYLNKVSDFYLVNTRCPYGFDSPQFAIE